jgi:beta-lactam-binding protein with PASTA domain
MPHFDQSCATDVPGTLTHPPCVFGGAASITNTPEVCTVPKVTGKTLSAATRLIVRAHSRLGKIRRAYSKRVKRGRVISQKLKFGAVLPNRGKVNFVVSRGRRPT